MPKDMAERLEALADLLPERPEIAAELRELATAGRAQRQAAGMARAEAQRAAMADVQDAALVCASEARRLNPTVSQAVVAMLIKLDFGARVPAEDRLRRWVREWERAGQVPRCKRQPGRQRRTRPALHRRSG